MTVKIVPSSVISVVSKFIASQAEVKSIVFDPQTSFDSTRKSLYTSEGVPDSKKSMPVLSWGRSVIRRSEQGRIFSSKAKVPSGAYSSLKIAMCEFDFKFTIYTTSTRKLEELELDYYTKVGFASLATVRVDVPMLGLMDYSIQWAQSLDDAQFNIDGDFYQSITGTAVIKGPFICASEISTDDMKTQILNIAVTLQGCNGEDLGKDTITTGD